MNQLFKKEDLIGKTIEKIISTGCHYDDMFIKFTDGSFVVIDIDEVGEGFSSAQAIVIEQWKKDKTCSELVELGVITKQEYDEAVRQEEVEFKNRQLEREKKEAERLEEQEKEQLQALKNKYES